MSARKSKRGTDTDGHSRLSKKQDQTRNRLTDVLSVEQVVGTIVRISQTRYDLRLDTKGHHHDMHETREIAGSLRTCQS